MWQFIGQIIGCLLVAALIGFLVGWLMERVRLTARFKERIEGLETELRDSARNLETAQNEKGTFAARATKLESELAASNTLLKAREATVAEQNTRLRDQADLLRKIGEKDGELTRLRWRLSELEQRYGAGGNIPLRADPKVPYEKDDLKRIQGVGVVAADILSRMNITTFRQIAQWTEADIQRVSELLGQYQERINREDWIGHAKEQHLLKYGERI